MHRELARPSVTLQTLWVEYRDAAAGRMPLKPYEYSRFCDLYAPWKKTIGVVMRQVHRAGEKAFIDYSGKKPHIVDPETGEVTAIELFVAVLGASNYTFAKATRSQKLADVVGSTIRASSTSARCPRSSCRTNSGAPSVGRTGKASRISNPPQRCGGGRPPRAPCQQGTTQTLAQAARIASTQMPPRARFAGLLQEQA